MVRRNDECYCCGLITKDLKWSPYYGYLCKECWEILHSTPLKSKTNVRDKSDEIHKTEVIYLVFEPLGIKRFMPLQLLIQLRTWGRATHVGYSLNPEGLSELIDELKVNKHLSRKDCTSVGNMISATWPKVKKENIFENYINTRVYLKLLKVPKETKEKIDLYWKQRKGKEAYSLAGLVWFVLGPFLDIFKKHKDIDKKREFCSEAATNSLAFAGIKAFSFLSHPAEKYIYLARSNDYEYWKRIVDEKIIKDFGFDNSKEFYDKANGPEWYWGYKISPRIFRICPIFEDIGIMEIRKDKIYWK